MTQGEPPPSSALPRPALVAALSGLSIVGGSAAAAVLFAWQLAELDDAVGFVSSNALALRARGWMIGASLGAGLFAVIVGAAWAYWFARDRQHGADRCQRLGRLLSPFLLFPLLPSLFVRGPWEGRELLLLVTIGVVSLALERLLALSFAAWPRRWWRANQRVSQEWDPRLGSFVSMLLVFMLACYYFYFVGERAVLVHHKMLTSSSDLAEFDNLFYNALHGHPFRSPAIEGDLEDWSALKVHAEFGLYLLLPLYALRPRAESLLWIQAGVIALSAVPAYLIAARRLGRLAGLLFAVVLLFLPVVQRPNFYDFHFSPFGMLLVLWTLYFLDGLLLARAGKARADGGATLAKQRLLAVGFWSFFVLALLSREDVSLGLGFVGLFVLFVVRQIELGSSIFLLSLTYFVTVKFGIMPRFGKMWFDAIYQDLKAPEAGGFGAVALTLISNPAFVLRSLLTEPKFLYALHMTVPVLGLWLRRPYLWFAAAPGFISTLLVTNRSPMFESSFQYAYLWVPYILMGGVLYLSELTPRSFARGWELLLARRRAALLALALAATASCFQMGILLGGDKIRGGFIDKGFVVSEAEHVRLDQLRSLIAKIPAEASVTASEAIGPHVSNRLVLYSLKFTLGKSPDYLLIELPRMPSERAHARMALESGEYGVVERRGPFWLLQKGGPKKFNRALQRALGRS